MSETVQITFSPAHECASVYAKEEMITLWEIVADSNGRFWCNRCDSLLGIGDPMELEHEKKLMGLFDTVDQTLRTQYMSRALSQWFPIPDEILMWAFSASLLYVGSMQELGEVSLGLTKWGKERWVACHE